MIQLRIGPDNEAAYRNKFPEGLTELCIKETSWTSLPPLPSTLETLWCHFNTLTSLPPFPSTLKKLYCHYNLLTDLPPLPSSLEVLSCYNNQLTSFPSLPSTLKEIYCHNNGLTLLPPLPSTLKKFWCDNNKLTSLPPLPSTLPQLRCYSNPFVWCAQKDVKWIKVNKQNNAKLLKYACLTMIVKALVDLYVEPDKMEEWLDKPITDDGRMGIAVRYGMKLCMPASMRKPAPFQLFHCQGVWQWKSESFDEKLLVPPL